MWSCDDAGSSTYDSVRESRSILPIFWSVEMKLKGIRVEAFKGIKSCAFEFTDATMLVGTNNAGKSSVLQAIHLASRVIQQANEANKQSTLSLNAAEYVPSESYWELGHNAVWGNKVGSPESKVTFFFSDPNNGPDAEAFVALKSARNEGISVNPKIDPRVASLMRDKHSIFSAYIPGIAGIPLQEALISTRHIYRKAASGDSNIVLRNILLRITKENKISTLLDYVHDIYPDVSLDVKFDEDNDYVIKVNVTFSSPAIITKPLEFSGAGFIHALQIFSYLVLFKPKILLIDEPECHLHPTLQTKLIISLQKRAQENDAVALITTHSPFISRGLPAGSRTVWIDRGEVVADSKESAIRDALGWGALDKSILFCTEDSRLGMLSDILGQEQSYAGKVAVFPFDGVSKLGSGSALIRLRKALGDHHKIVVHRDRDCMTESEIKTWADEYSVAGLLPWVTAGSDMEMYYCQPSYIAGALSISDTEAEEIIKEVIEDKKDEFKTIFRNKRAEINKKIYATDGGSPSTDDLWSTLPYTESYKGKKLLSSVREKVKAKGFDEKLIGKPAKNVLLAEDLVEIIKRALCM